MGEPVQGCDLCEAAHTTEWFYEDDRCWVAECEACDVPMVVWKQHDPDPPEEIRAELIRVLAAVVAQHYESECWFDETMRSIPHHYHAHARPRGGFSGLGSRRQTAR
jgi:hypothetical protein